LLQLKRVFHSTEEGFLEKGAFIPLFFAIAKKRVINQFHSDRGVSKLLLKGLRCFIEMIEKRPKDDFSRLNCAANLIIYIIRLFAANEGC
jgi:hypothetical protein